MSSRDGFVVRDRHVGTLFDEKMIRAVARLGVRALAAYDAVVDVSWSVGERVCLADAALRLPRAYDLGDLDEVLAVLVEEGLLEPGGKVPAGVWSRWYGDAWRRRDDSRRAGRAGAAKRWGTPRNGAANGAAISDANGTPNALNPPTDPPSIEGGGLRRKGGTGGRNGSRPVNGPDAPKPTVRVWSGPERVSAVLGPSDGRGDDPRGEDGGLRRLPRPAFLGGDVTEVLET